MCVFHTKSEIYETKFDWNRKTGTCICNILDKPGNDYIHCKECIDFKMVLKYTQITFIFFLTFKRVDSNVLVPNIYWV